MKTKYRVKKSARQFFEDKWHDDVMTIEGWNKNKAMPIELLEEVENVHIEYGHDKLLPETGTRAGSLCGYDHEKKLGHFHFTVWINDFEYEDYNDRDVAPIMDEIQKVLNKHFKH